MNSIHADGVYSIYPPCGQRGQRYAWIEAGAAAQNIQLQATADGLGSVLVAGFPDDDTSKVLALNSSIKPLIHLCFDWPDVA